MTLENPSPPPPPDFCTALVLRKRLNQPAFSASPLVVLSAVASTAAPFRRRARAFAISDFVAHLSPGNTAYPAWPAAGHNSCFDSDTVCVVRAVGSNVTKLNLHGGFNNG